MRHFCTYFDSNFLYQGLALYHSLRQHAGDFRLHVLCLDERAENILVQLALPGLIPLGINRFEQLYPQLLQAKDDRTRVEYYWTCTPWLIRHVLAELPADSQLAYLDADLFFYAGLEPIYEEWGQGELFLVPHRLEHVPENQAVVGRFNVGLVGFRHTSQVRACLDRWAAQCLEWCHLCAEDGKLGDQKYLDEWPDLYSGVVVCQHHGVGAGAWNIRQYRLHQQGGELLLDQWPLVMLHLNFVEIHSRWYINGLALRWLRPAYSRYACSIGWAARLVRQWFPDYRPRAHDLKLRQWLSEWMHGGIIPVPFW